MRFSQRIGKTEIQTTIQSDTMSDSFENRLNNEIVRLIEEECLECYIEPQFTRHYCYYFGYRETDWSDSASFFIEQLNRQNAGDVYQIYDTVEFLVKYLIATEKIGHIKQFNAIFELEKSAYRLDENGQLIKITDEIELEEVNRAIDLSRPYDNVYEHLEKARSFFSDREQPDYDKTIVESVHAIEAICRDITDDEKATLGDTLKNMELHKALEGSLTKLYGFSSDTVRHAKKSNNIKIDENDARLILITSHSMVNYLISKYL